MRLIAIFNLGSEGAVYKHFHKFVDVFFSRHIKTKLKFNIYELYSLEK